MYADCACDCGCEAIVADPGEFCEDCLLERCDGVYPPGPARVARVQTEGAPVWRLYDGSGETVVGAYETRDGYGKDGSLSGEDYVRRLASQMLSPVVRTVTGYDPTTKSFGLQEE